MAKEIPASPVAPSSVPSDAAQEEQLLAAAEKKVDMLKPLVWQIHQLSKAEYLPWVHTPFTFGPQTNMKQSRLFKWSFLEPLSYTKWWMIPMIWLPCIALAWLQYFKHADASLVNGLATFAAGLAAWTLVEYGIHRFLFHLDDILPDNGWVLTLHFLLHGVHHRVPMDPDRLVMPPVLFAALATCVYNVLRPALLSAGMPPHVFLAFFASGVLGYVCYDMVHYSQHHATRVSKGSFFAQFLDKDSHWFSMRQYHMKHHWSGLHGVGFGITSKIWDRLFGTELTEDMWRHKRRRRWH